MNCERVEEIISLYIDDQLDPVERIEVEAHFEQCESCMKQFEYFTEVVRSVNQLPQIDLPQGYHEELMAKIGQIDHPSLGSIKPVKIPFYKSWKALSTCAAAVFLVWIIAGTGGVGQKSSPMPQEMIIMEAPMAEQENTAQIFSEDMAAKQESVELNLNSDETNVRITANSSDTSIIIPEKSARVLIEISNPSQSREHIETLIKEKGGEMEKFSHPYNKILDGTGISMMLKTSKSQYASLYEELQSMGFIVKEEIDPVPVQYTVEELEAQRVQWDKEYAVLLNAFEQTHQPEEKDRIQEQLLQISRDMQLYSVIGKTWNTEEEQILLHIIMQALQE